MLARQRRLDWRAVGAEAVRLLDQVASAHDPRRAALSMALEQGFPARRLIGMDTIFDNVCARRE